MKRCVVLLLPALMALAGLRAAQAAAPPSCDECKDLPMLYRELLEQEFLLAKFKSWVDQAYYPASIKSMQDSASAALTTAMNGDLYGTLKPPAGNGPGVAAPAYGTQIADAKCTMVEYVRKKPGDAELTPVPISATDVAKKLCKPLADYTVAHEMHHVASCKAAWGAGDKTVETVEWFVKNDVEAYQVGIQMLREQIAALARKCGWTGSPEGAKPDKGKTLPTPQQILDYGKASKTKASALDRATRK